jgi:recombinational DNA repair ATPase RecF
VSHVPRTILVVDDVLLDAVLARLDDEAQSPPEGVAQLVLAALEGEGVLGALLASDQPDLSARPSRPSGEGRPDHDNQAVPRVFLQRVQVAGFRGIGPPAELKLQPGPGLTVICGRNGSGKSSFADALEVLFTGQLKRWERRSADWKETWRCLHYDDALVDAEVLVEGIPGVTTLRRKWPEGEKRLENAVTAVQAVGKPKACLQDFGWDRAAAESRPFLSHAELEALLDQPKALHDQLNDLLGLEDLDQAAERLRRARTELAKQADAAKRALPGLRAALAGATDDERASEAARLLAARAPDLEVLEALALGAGAPNNEDTSLLQDLAALSLPSREEVENAAEALRSAATALSEAQDETSAGADAQARLLSLALEHLAAHPSGTCPVCGTPGAIDGSWKSRTEEALARAESASLALRGARQAVFGATGEARSIMGPLPVALVGASKLGLDADEAKTAWEAWASYPPSAGPVALAGHLEAAHAELAPAVERLRVAAQQLRSSREAVWAPLARAVVGWCGQARLSARAAERLRLVRKAEDWLVDANAALRDERLRPVAEQVKQNWDELRHASNVDLLGLRLTGKGNQARVDFQVEVDGAGATGLGVMSQGETNALALSVFLPRAMLPGSPFGFLVIDDPVQAMDPAKVDGLARVLARAGESRQVVVFTHDERLPEAVRRLGLPARVLRVSRRASSQVQVDVAGDPVSSLLEDARQVLRTEEVPREVVRAVVPGICRTALEARLVDLARRRLLSRGAEHADAEEALSRARRLWERLSLALKGEIVADADVQSWLTNRLGKSSTDLFHELNRSAHPNLAGVAVEDLPNATRKLARDLENALA